MHEYSIIENVLSIVAETAAARSLSRVTTVTLRIGRLHQVSADIMRFAFTIASQDTVAHGAALSIEFVDITARCHDCGAQFVVGEHVYVCGACGGADIDILSGDELIVQSMEGET